MTLPKIDEYITIVNYDPRWPSEYEKEAQKLRDLFKGRILLIEHFGSTSVPNLSSKPIIDILIGLREATLTDEELHSLSNCGYEYFGEAGIPGRLYLCKRNTEKSFNLAIVKIRSTLWNDNIAIRELLRNDNEIATRYSKLKIKIIGQGKIGLLAYSQAKGDFMSELLLLARKRV